MAKTYEESMEELRKAFPADHDPTEEDAIEALNRAGAAALAKSASADDGSDDLDEEPEDDDEDKDDDDEDEDAAKSFDAVTETEYLDEDEVYGKLVKSANGDLSLLINGDDAVRELVKAFAGSVGATNRSVARVVVLLKAAEAHAYQQDRALIDMGRRLKSLETFVDGQPVKKAASGLQYGRESKVVGNAQTAIGKALGAGSTDNRFGGVDPDRFATLVKAEFADEETRTKFNLQPEHLIVQKAGANKLPNAFVAHLAEKYDELQF